LVERAAYSMRADSVEFSAIATATVEFRSSNPLEVEAKE
jgi:hypothetical protein